MNALSSIPTGLQPSAQGCALRATLGHVARHFSQPHGLCLWQILFGISQVPQIPAAQVSKWQSRPGSVLLRPISGGPPLPLCPRSSPGPACWRARGGHSRSGP